MLTYTKITVIKKNLTPRRSRHMQPHSPLLDALQWIGGVCYLFNKIFLSIAERYRTRGKTQLAQRLRIASWAIYVVGLPFIVVMLALCHNWIAASVELSGAPSMILGLYLAIRGTDTKPPKWLDRLALACIPVGFAYSIYDLHGLSHLSQWLEIGLVVGFLVGTYQLARDRASGYLWYVLMHVACGTLMWMQGLRWFALQQLVSLAFIGDAFTTRLRRPKTT